MLDNFWKRSFGGHDYWLTCELDPGKQRLLIPFLLLGLCFPLAFLALEADPRTQTSDSWVMLRLSGQHM